ncbi:MAG: PD40 domain-containing protein [Acidobacteria bacterium]|nr:PD40 domain-containing protein [Acidobacteriota bacterium]
MDATSRTLHRDGELLPATPKVFEALLLLLERGNRAVTREELASRLWPGQMATEANLNQHVSMLRRLLSNGHEGERCLVTLPGRGYQWVLPVEVEREERATFVPAPVSTAPSSRYRWIWLTAGLGALAIGSAALAFHPWKSPERTGRVATVEKLALTRLPGSAYQPALSRDGSKVAFVWDQEGRHEPGVFVKGPEDDEPRPVSRGEFEHSSPAWSPGGRELAYLRYETSAIRVVVHPERGGESHAIAALYQSRYGLDCRHLDWSPDGTTLAVDDKLDPTESFGIFLIDVRSGIRTRLTQPSEIIGDVDPRFSPDGSRVSFVRMTDRFKMELVTVDLKDRQLRWWTHDGQTISGHDWSPDGSQIYFASNRTGEFRVWRVGLNGAAAVPTGISSANPVQLSASRSGSKLVYSDVLDDLNIWRLDLTRNGKDGDGWSRVVSSTAEDSLPQVSPDGSRLCYRSDRSDDGQLWVSDIDGGHASQITREPLRPVAGRWSPDSRSLVFNDAADRRMYRVDRDGGPARLLGGTGAHPMFSADGRAIYFNDRGIQQMDSDGGHVRPLLEFGAVHQKLLSPDGRYLYFTGERTGTVIWRYELAGGKVTEVLNDLLSGYWGAWVAGRRGIYYLGADREHPGGAAIYLLPEGSGTAVRKARFPGPLPPIGTTMWSLTPDERYLYCVRVDRSHSDLSLVEGLR